MVRLHELSLGDVFEDLLVEVWQLEGVDPASKPRDPVYSAIVRDPSGYCRLIYRANNSCKPSNVKRGKFYRISGKVSSYKGRMQIQIGSSWGRVEKVNGDEFVCNLPYSPATDLSAMERWYGALVVHATSSGGGEHHRLRAYMLPMTRQQQQQQQQQQQAGPPPRSGGGSGGGGGGGGGGSGAAAGLLPMPPTPVPCTTAAYVETERAAANRALRDVLRVAPDAVRILPLPPVLHIQSAGATGGATGAAGGGAAPSFWHIFPAVLQCTDEDLKFVFGEPRGGSWVDLDELTAAEGPVAPSWRPPLVQLGALLRSAHVAGLVDLHLPPPEPAAAAAAAAAEPRAAELRATAEPAAESSSQVAASESLSSPAATEPAVAADCSGPAEEEPREQKRQQPQQQQQQPQRKLPVTLISGFLGAGKTTLLRHILTNREPDMRCAVVVNDMAELNIDAALVAHGSLSAAAATSSLAAGGGVGAAAVVAAAPERLVELHNGCICCTLRGDLVQQVAEIAADGRFDYCVVESTGIGEPMQVAETFEFPLDGSDPAAALALEAAAAAVRAAGSSDGADRTAAATAAGGPRRLADVARLDTCVTVVDAANLLDNLHSLETLKDREEHERVHAHGGGRREGPEARARAAAAAAAAPAGPSAPEAGAQPPPQLQPPAQTARQPDCNDHDCDHDHGHGHDGPTLEPRPGQEDEDEELERNVADLLLDQLEFADVILLNKMDTVSSEQLHRLMALVAAINPSARVLPTTQSHVPLTEVLNTGRFSLERAREGAGWLKAIREGTDLVPETAEYGITSFVWRSRRPFHPARLHAFMDRHFVLQQPDWSLADGGEGVTGTHTTAAGATAATADAVEEPQEQTGAGAIVLARPPAAAAAAAAGGGIGAGDGGGGAAAGLEGDLAAAARAQAATAAAIANVFAGGAFNPGGAAAGGFPFGGAFPFGAGAGAGAGAGVGGGSGAAGGVPPFGFPFGAAGAGGFSLDAALQAAAGAAVAAASAANAAAAAAATAAAAAAAVAAAAANPAPAPNAGTRPPPPPPPAEPPRASAGGATAAPAADVTGGTAGAKGAARTAAYGQVLRSKGFAWVAGRDDHVGEWSSAGNLIRFGTGGPWYDVLPREAWPSEPDKVVDIEKDFLPGIGDRRQELVFIGIDMKRDALVAALEACLATSEEEEELKRAAAAAAAAVAAGERPSVPSALDPFLPWPDIQDIMDAGEEEEEEEGEEDEEVEEEEDGEVEDGEVDGPMGRWEPGQVLDDISDGAAELQQLLDDTEQPAVVVLWHAPWATASREAEAGLAALASKYPELVFVRLDVTASQANEALAVSGSRLLALPTSRRSDARPTLRDGSKWPALTLHRPPGLRHEAYFAGPTALAELRSELARRQSEWADAAVNGGAAGAEDSGSSTPGPALRRRQQRAESVPATPAKPTTAVAAAPRPPASTSSSSAQQQQQQQQPTRISELRRGAADLKSHLQEAQDACCPLVVAWLAAPPPTYPSTPTVSVPSAASASATSSTLATPPPPPRRIAAQAPSASSSSSAAAVATPKHAFDLLELSEQDQAALRVEVAAACSLYGAAVRVLFADPGASSANRALAEALRVAAAPTLQLYLDMKMVKALKGVGAVGKLAATLAEVAPPRAAATASQPPLEPPQRQTGSLPQPQRPVSVSASASATASASGPGASPDTSSSAPAAAAGAGEPQHTPSVYDPPTGKYGKPGVYKQFGPRGRGVYWPRMPCLRCGCPWWLGEDWDAECVRCGWDCEADGYDDDSNPLPAFKAKYDAFTAALREGRTPAWRGKHVGPRG